MVKWVSLKKGNLPWNITWLLEKRPVCIYIDRFDKISTHKDVPTGKIFLLSYFKCIEFFEQSIYMLQIKWWRVNSIIKCNQSIQLTSTLFSQWIMLNIYAYTWWSVQAWNETDNEWLSCMRASSISASTSPPLFFIFVCLFQFTVSPLFFHP